MQAFKKNGKRVIIAGDGPDKTRLMELAGDAASIRFVGRVSEAEKFDLLAKAKAFVFTSVEDFGIAPIEALATATPVIALKGGGLSETITQNKTGIFFDAPTAASLNSAISQFEKHQFDPKLLQQSAQRYSEVNFQTNFTKAIKRLYEKAHNAKN